MALEKVVTSTESHVVHVFAVRHKLGDHGSEKHVGEENSGREECTFETKHFGMKLAIRANGNGDDAIDEGERVYVRKESGHGQGLGCETGKTDSGDEEGNSRRRSHKEEEANACLLKEDNSEGEEQPSIGEQEGEEKEVNSGWVVVAKYAAQTKHARDALKQRGGGRGRALDSIVRVKCGPNRSSAVRQGGGGG